jgi:cbb3-type cytochrome oxidase subunit 3
MIMVSEQLLFWIGLGIVLVCIVAWAFLSRRRAAEDRLRDKLLEARLSGGAEDVLEKKGRQLGSEHERRGS